MASRLDQTERVFFPARVFETVDDIRFLVLTLVIRARNENVSSSMLRDAIQTLLCSFTRLRGHGREGVDVRHGRVIARGDMDKNQRQVKDG